MARNSRRLSNALPNRKSVTTAPRAVAKYRRNEPCPCGSGKKYKDCHLRDGEAFLQKLARAEEKQRQRDEGAPWYVRWFT